jgi:hypothetical protein
LNVKPSLVKNSIVLLRSFTGKFTKIFVAIVLERRLKTINALS